MPIDEVSERSALLDLKKGRKHNALCCLMKAYGTELYRYCYSFLNNKDDAEDMLQLTFMQAFEGLHKFSANASFRSWLYTIARNRCLDKLKGDRRLHARVIFIDAPPEAEADFGDSADPVANEQLNRILRDCLQRLSEAVRSTVLLRFQGELSYREIAEIMQENSKTLQTRVTRALPALRDCLREYGVSL